MRGRGPIVEANFMLDYSKFCLQKILIPEDGFIAIMN